MLTVAIFAAMLQSEETERTPAIYRLPAAEAESHFFEKFIDEEGFDQYCVEPKPGPKATALVKQHKLKFVSAKDIDTPTNLRWRNATIDFVNGKLSPKAWWERTSNLPATVHFLSNPKVPDLRGATGLESRTAVFAEMLLLSLPGKPCLTADDIWQTRYFPGPGRHESWILAMNDYRGPMLSYRHDNPSLVVGRPKLIRADAKPGILVVQQPGPKKTITFYFNNGPSLLDLPPVNLDQMTINIGIDMEGPKPRLQPHGFLIVES